MKSIKSILLLFSAWLFFSAGSPHPLYVSVLDLDHNEKERRLEMTCRIFTNDFEETLRKYHREKIDLLSPALHERMGVLMDDYIHRHLNIEINDAQINYRFIGFEQSQESVELYFEANATGPVKKVRINNDLLYDFQSKQMNLIHVTVGGERKSTRLNHPDSTAVFRF
jgi:hypothetical protein